eukprot:Gb_10773 [translate_table: standard]
MTTLTMRKEIIPFLPKKMPTAEVGNAEECSDVLVVNNSMALVVHNEDANVSVLGHVYLIKATLPDGSYFTAFTYAGELPSCAFGFNSHGVAFTLNAVPPTKDEVAAGGIGRNFVSRDLLEAINIEDALRCVHLPDISVGHSYNLIDVRMRRLFNVETASNNRISLLEIEPNSHLCYLATRQMMKTLHADRSEQPNSQNHLKQKYFHFWEILVMQNFLFTCKVLLLNFRKEIIPFLPKKMPTAEVGNAEECSDVLVVNNSMALVVHNEDANVSVLGHVYLIKATLPDGSYFTAFTYAGELPSCAFGFNSHGVAFTLNAVPPTKDEVAAGGIGRNFVSRDLLEAINIEDALRCVHLPDISVGHSYNLIDVRMRRLFNVETASNNRISLLEIGQNPFFHANMYLHLEANDENSSRRQKRAAELPKSSQAEILSLLGDTGDAKFPIYMQGIISKFLITLSMEMALS